MYEEYTIDQLSTMYDALKEIHTVLVDSDLTRTDKLDVIHFFVTKNMLNIARETDKRLTELEESRVTD